MITFQDGPAAGVELNLGRAPLYLRAVLGVTGKWDALDEPDDRPRPREKVTVYRRIGDPFEFRITLRGKSGRRQARRMASADYRAVVDQPEDAIVRDTAAWRQWCMDRVHENTLKGVTTSGVAAEQRKEQES